MEGAGGRTPLSPQDELERDACLLADGLNDPGSLDYFRVVVSTVPREVVAEAFVRARDIPRSDLRRSRAAVFTALVRTYVAGARWRRSRWRRPPPTPTPCPNRV